MNWFKKFWKGLNQPMRVEARPGKTLPREERAMDTSANFTPRAQQVLGFARKEADRLNHNFLGTEHLLLGLVRLGQGCAVNVLKAQGVDLEKLRDEVEKQVGTGPDQKIVGNFPYTPRVKKVVALAHKEMLRFNHTYLGTEHLLLGLLREGEGVAAKVLRALNVDLEQTRTKVLRELDPLSSQANEGELQKIILPVKPAGLPTVNPAPEQSSTAARSDSVDINKRYDIYCCERNRDLVVYRNARFLGAKLLDPMRRHDRLSDFVELEQADGQIVLVALDSIVKFCGPGVKPNGEQVQE
jgi:hypothetical protein